MMMNRGHLKNSLTARLLKIGDLNNDREHLHQIDQTDYRNIQRHLHHKGTGCHKTAQSQRTGAEERPAAERSSQSDVRPVMQGSAGFRGKSKNFIEDDDDFSFEFLNK